MTYAALDALSALQVGFGQLQAWLYAVQVWLPNCGISRVPSSQYAYVRGCKIQDRTTRKSSHVVSIDRPSTKLLPNCDTKL